ncbi:unnamed protein product [Didymodactylos carnosus]|uniref:Uncharacterized protein n=1 Tax=Didymodactylos carnosus TaxID=1234261 RepID=A0A8S2Q8V1_9BILA|nr:unnamed protein product [Didymodactylos carnosus]CAF4087399.1 unnamed protein product [Didymodactylos carnosus]
MMSFLSDLQACSRPKLRHVTTRVIQRESKYGDGTFQISDRPTDSNGVFMIIDNSLDEKLQYVIDSAYIGTQDSTVNRATLNECKITHIANVATGISNAFSEQYKYLNIELLDTPETTHLPRSSNERNSCAFPSKNALHGESSSIDYITARLFT